MPSDSPALFHRLRRLANPAAPLRILSVLFLSAGILTAGAGLLVRTALAPAALEEPAQIKLPLRAEAAAPSAEDKKPQVRLDQTGDPLPEGAIARLGTTRFRHGAMVDCLAFAADGKTLVSCSPFNGMRFWDAATGKEIQRFPEQALSQEMALSPDGKWLAITVRRDNANAKHIALRDFASGRLLRRFGNPDSPSKLLFSPDGKVLAAYQWAKDIELWDPATGRHLHTLKGHTDIVWADAFFTDRKTLVSASFDMTIRFWDVAAGKQLRQIKHNQEIGQIARSPDGKLLATIDFIKKEVAGGVAWRYDNRVRLWEVESGKELRQLAMPAKGELQKEGDGFLALGFAPDGKTLLTGDRDGVLRLWDPAMAREIRRFSGFALFPSRFTFAPDGKSLALMDGSSTIRQIRLADGKDLVPCRGHRSGVSSVVVTPDCQSIVTSSLDGSLRFWEPRTGRELRQRVAAPIAFWSKLQSDGRTYVVAGNDRTYRLHDLKSGDKLAVVRGFQATHSFALSTDRKTLASINADNEICLFDVNTGTVRHTLTKVTRISMEMSFTADGRTLAVWDGDRLVTVWDAASGKKRRQFRIGPMPGETVTPGSDAGMTYTAALSPDGRLLAAGVQVSQIVKGRKPQGILPVLDTNTGKEICRLATGSDGARELAFSPDGKSLAWSGWSDGTLYLGEIATGGERQRFTGHHGEVVSLAFSSDGKTLISGSQDATALVWDLTGRLTSDRKDDKPLSAGELKQFWDALAAEDAAAGFRAIQALSADLERAIPYLRQRLHPAAVVDEERLKRLIADLDSEQFAARDNASTELEKLGESALHELRKAVEGRPTLESRRRLDQLIEKQEREQWKQSADKRRTGRALEVLERAGTGEARRVLATLAGGAPAARLTLDAKEALARLAK